nr:hypothetical protein [Tanacetum cinerariifolium]
MLGRVPTKMELILEHTQQGISYEVSVTQTVNETFHVQTDDELTDKELKQIEADDQAIQTILLGLLEDIYAAVDTCETAQEMWLQVQQMMKGSDIGIQEENAKLFNEWEMFTSNKRESIEYYYHCFLKLINDLKRNKHFPEKIASNLKFLNNLRPEWSRHVIQNSVQNLRVQNIRNQNGLIGVQGNGNQNQIVNGNLVAARAEGNAAGQNGNQIRCYNCRGVDGSAEVHKNCDDNEIFNMFTQEEKYTELLEPISEPLQVPQNDNGVTSKVTSVEQSGEIVEQHSANFEETHLNKQLSKEKSTISFLLEEKKKLKSDFKTREDELIDKQIQLEKRIKELNNILVKTGQSIQTINMLSPKPDSFYHIEQKMALGYQNPFYLKQAQKKQQSLYDEKVLLKKHDPPVVHDSKETL